jgi:hypothetical protein
MKMKVQFDVNLLQHRSENLKLARIRLEISEIVRMWNMHARDEVYLVFY